METPENQPVVQQPAPSPARKSKQPRTYRVSWPVVFIVSLLVFVGLGVWQYGRVNKLTSQLSAKEEQLQAKQKEIAQLVAEKDKALSAVTQFASTPEFIAIPEWSVKFRPGADLQDLSYFVYKDTLLPSTKSLLQTSYTASITRASEPDAAEKYRRCEAGAFGTIGRGKAGTAIIGVATAIEKIPGALKVGEYYYYVQGPQAACSADKTTADLQAKQTAALKEAIKTLVPSSE